MIKINILKEMSMKVILASQSPRRRELMDLAKFDYEILASNFDEKVDKNLSLEVIV